MVQIRKEELFHNTSNLFLSRSFPSRQDFRDTHLPHLGFTHAWGLPCCQPCSAELSQGGHRAAVSARPRTSAPARLLEAGIQGTGLGGRERGESCDFCPINSPVPAVGIYVRGDGVCPHGMGRTSGLLCLRNGIVLNNVTR